MFPLVGLPWESDGPETQVLILVSLHVIPCHFYALSPQDGQERIAHRVFKGIAVLVILCQLPTLKARDYYH